MIDRREPLTFAPLGQADRGDLQKLAGQVGWQFTDEQVALFTAAGTVYGLHDQRDGRKLVGASAIYPYGRDLASLGIVMVSPQVQRQGIGTAIVRRCLADVNVETNVMLVATPQGKPVYESLGFRVVEHVHRYEFDLASARAFSYSDEVTPLRPEDVAAVIAFDEAVCGGNRGCVYQVLLEMARAGVVVRDSQGAIGGFTIAARGKDRWLIGPVIANGTKMAATLVQSLVHSLCAAQARGESGTVRLDVPGCQMEFQKSLQDLGFQESRVSPVMSLGGKRLPGNRERLFAMIDPALG